MLRVIFIHYNNLYFLFIFADNKRFLRIVGNIFGTLIISGCALSFIIAVYVIACCRPDACRRKTKQGYILSKSSEEAGSPPKILVIDSQFSPPELKNMELKVFSPSNTSQTVQHHHR